MTPPSDSGTVPVVNLDDWEDNVWATSSSNTHHHTFTPSLTDATPAPARSSHTLHRRRTSENASTPSRKSIPWTIQHSRAESSNSVRGHPLKRDSGVQSSQTFNDPTVTRPILNLWLSPSSAVDVDKNTSEAEHEAGVDSGEKEELVLIHEVTATDSLQGVSLKYGISMADLRKANQMWPSDSIHLRKTLNVPVNKASKLRKLGSDGPTKGQETSSPSSSTASLETTPDVRRIPASHLSFFPQRSRSDVPSVDGVVANAERPRISDLLNSNSSALSPNSSSSNSSSIFSTFPRAFPIGKDTIMSRLSLDSGGTSPKEEQGHEMGVVGRNTGFNDIRSNVSRRHRDKGTDTKTTNRMGDQSLRDGKQARSRNHYGYRIGEEERECASTVIRTSQLEPSPEMLVPVLGQKRAKGE